MKSPHVSYSLLLVSIQIFHQHPFNLDFHILQHSDKVTMALQLNNSHIRYYHMDTTQSVGLMWNYLSHPDYLVIQGWIYATSLYPDTTNQTGPHVYHYDKFFWGSGLHASGHLM